MSGSTPLHGQQQGRFNPLHFFSDVSLQRYHELSDTTMDTLLESLENLLDNLGSPDLEVEYHVCIGAMSFSVLVLTEHVSERCINAQTGRKGYVCHQQATPQ